MTTRLLIGYLLLLLMVVGLAVIAAWNVYYSQRRIEKRRRTRARLADAARASRLAQEERDG